MIKPPKIGRRNFLKSAAGLAAIAMVPLSIKNIQASTKSNNPTSKLNRILGKNSAAMEVSAIGFGCMGLNYHRSQHPNKNQSIYLLQESADKGIPLFVTAEKFC